ncbi:hypothetical protein C882_2924 [Caenispirillum salinarum AK4]|uniref:Lipoprotein n=1 Tax=Caenispirillum salinarum AK4 TaxID=1238182 RepID=K9HBR4_9PROT|nr:hypothetical protein [Caenispirillum salinarum]EKV26156.1 hypothetical protein C882_2924 [Caenispirillum salinarum AK4]
MIFRYLRARAALLAFVLASSACTTVEVSEETRADLRVGAAVADAMPTARAAVPDGWRLLPPVEIERFVAGRTLNVHYLSSNPEVFQYGFTGTAVSRQRVAGGMGVTAVQGGTWEVDRGRLCANWNVRLCYDVFTNGEVVLARRTYGGRSYVDLWDPQTPGYQPPAEGPAARLTRAEVRACAMEMSPAVREVYTRFEARARDGFGADFDRHPDMTPATVRGLLRDVVIEAVADDAITPDEARTMRSTLGLCFRPAGGAASS